MKVKASKVTQLQHGWSVETWWDRRSRVYITQLKDDQQNQVGDADMDAVADDAVVAHRWMIDRSLDFLKEAGLI